MNKIDKKDKIDKKKGQINRNDKMDNLWKLIKMKKKPNKIMILKDKIKTKMDIFSVLTYCVTS